jgi:hypothetical protein
LGAATGAAGAIELGPGLAIAAPNADAAQQMATDIKIRFMKFPLRVVFLLGRRGFAAAGFNPASRQFSMKASVGPGNTRPRSRAPFHT